MTQVSQGEPASALLNIALLADPRDFAIESSIASVIIERRFAFLNN
jgi:hypothetical protein